MARTYIFYTLLALVGAGLWGVCGSKLNQLGRFDYEPNPLGIKKSPYGELLAMAVQSPINSDWHGVMESHGPAPEEETTDHSDHDCGSEHCDHQSHIAEEDTHDHHDCGNELCDHKSHNVEEMALLQRLEYAVSKRTNPNPPTEGHKLYIREEIEKRLRFAYGLDPSHYSNYAAYNLFLTHQNNLGTEGLSQKEVRTRVFELADRTIDYCLMDQDDPRSALTASTAVYNKIEQMLLAKPGTYTTGEMLKELKSMDFFLRRHFELLQNWVDNGNWNLISPARQQQILMRGKFGQKLRDNAEQSIKRIENQENPTAKLDF